MALILNTIQSAPVSIEELDAKGNKVPPTGPISWVSSDPAIVTVTPAADTFSAVVAATGVVGKATVTAADGALVGTLDVEVVTAPAVTLNIIAGTPTP